MLSDARREVVNSSSASGSIRPSRALPLWRTLAVLGVISTLMNLLMLVSVLFVVEVFREVIPNHNVHLLVVLFAIVVLAYLLYALLQLVRTRFLRSVANAFDQAYERAAFRTLSVAADVSRLAEDETAVRDLGRIRVFILDGALAALFDFPWTFVFIGLMTFLHPLLGAVSLVFTLIEAALAIGARHLSKGRRDWNEKSSPYVRAISAEDGAARAFGLAAQFEERWIENRRKRRRVHGRSQRLPDLLRSLARAAKMLHPVVALAVAVYLALHNLADFGIIIATGILARRIAEPVEAVVRGWPDISPARKAWTRLKKCRLSVETEVIRTASVRAAGTIVVDGVTGGPLAGHEPIVPPVSFKLHPGENLGVTGPSGSGKSALANILAGRWKMVAGKMLIGKVDRFQLSHEQASHLIGYVAQDSRFFDGSIAENISGFSSGLDEDLLVEAVRCAGLEEFVDRLEGGLHASMGATWRTLPGGIRQRLALARAIYRKPYLLILDDPGMCLDQDGKRFLSDIIEAHRKRGGIALICANEIPLLHLCDHILVMRAGKTPVIGTRDEILKNAKALT